MMDTDTESVTRRVYAVRQNVTQYVRADWLAKHGITGVYAVYLDSPDYVVHCCSLTPSREMWGAGYVWESDRDHSDAEREEIDSEIMGWDWELTEYWALPSGGGLYSGSVDRGGWEGEDEREAMDRACEHYAGNPTW